MASIAALIAQYVPQPTDLELFDMFNVDMTESHYLKWNDAGRVERVQVMQRAPGQKTSERMLWSIDNVSPEKLSKIQKREHAERLAALQAAYNADADYEMPLDHPVEGATNLVKEGKLHTSHLLDEHGELV